MTLTPEELDRLSKMSIDQIASDYQADRTSRIKNAGPTYWYEVSDAVRYGMNLQRQLSEWRKTQKEASKPKGWPNAKLLRMKFEIDLKDLKSKCAHSQISDWMDQYWAPGHSSGAKVRVCEDCETVIESKSNPLEFTVSSQSFESVPNEQTPKQEEKFDPFFVAGPPSKKTDLTKLADKVKKHMKSNPVESPRKEEEWTTEPNNGAMAYGAHDFFENESLIFRIDARNISPQKAQSICARLNAHPEVSLPSDEEIETELGGRIIETDDFWERGFHVGFREAIEWLRSRIKQ